MTRAERIEKAAHAVAHGSFLDFAKRDDTWKLWHTTENKMDVLREALALPPDPAPRRLTEDDMHMCELLRLHTHQEDADFLNARIFGETK